jgi:hypothetical protein
MDNNYRYCNIMQRCLADKMINNYLNSKGEQINPWIDYIKKWRDYNRNFSTRRPYEFKSRSMNDYIWDYITEVSTNKNYDCDYGELFRILYNIIKNEPKYGKIRNIKSINFIVCNRNINTYTKYRFIDLFCSIIDIDNLQVYNFEYCVSKIIKYIHLKIKYNKLKYNKLKYIDYFMEKIGKIYYDDGEIRQECLKKLINNNKRITQIFMEYLDFHYYKYVKNKKNFREKLHNLNYWT